MAGSDTNGPSQRRGLIAAAFNSAIQFRNSCASRRSNAIYPYPSRLTGRWDEPSDLSLPIDRK